MQWLANPATNYFSVTNSSDLCLSFPNKE
ncbi:rCG25010 [Rattus norvegicus]|uniref:RCG25010 n=1 Tax=Rattus norvegicus TaxID=10116 RepID=A6KFB9_RAT|nr:rCG25010 [Rattus norvegicus]